MEARVGTLHQNYKHSDIPDAGTIAGVDPMASGVANALEGGVGEGQSADSSISSLLRAMVAAAKGIAALANAASTHQTVLHDIVADGVAECAHVVVGDALKTVRVSALRIRAAREQQHGGCRQGEGLHHELLFWSGWQV